MKARQLLNDASARAVRTGTRFFRWRYRLLARALGLRPEGGAASPRGTLFVEIDGLGYGHLFAAMRRGYLPFTRRLLTDGAYRAHRWRCGLAADTPPVQSGLMYGSSEGVVGFYWWDRATQRRVVGANPNHMRRVQAELAARSGHEGLLAGGSSYSNIMSGGATYSVLTIAGANPHWFRPGQGLLRALALLALNPGKTVRFAFDTVWELLQEMEDRAFVTAMDRPRILEGAFPIVRVLLNVLAREIVTAGTRVDMLRGVPVIYSCYIGYDVVGHHSGPLSRNSLRVLRGIDGAIRKLFETASRSDRPYDIVLLSDHGMTPCQAAAEAFDQDFEEWVARWWRQGAQVSPTYTANRRRVRRKLRRRNYRRRGSWIAGLAGSVARRSSAWLRTWGRVGAWTLELGSSGAIKLGERFLEADENEDGPRIAVISCGPLSQLWVREMSRRLDLGEVEALCPGFVQSLVHHPAVHVVIGCDGEEVFVHGKRGTIVLRRIREREAGRSDTDNGDGHTPAQDLNPIVRTEGENPLLAYEEPEIVARQIASYASMKACGDVICFAATFRPESLRDATPGAVGERHVYSFEHQLGTHASVGGDQAHPFLMMRSEVPFDGAGIVAAAQLYPVLRKLVSDNARGDEPSSDGIGKNVYRARTSATPAKIASA